MTENTNKHREIGRRAKNQDQRREERNRLTRRNKPDGAITMNGQDIPWKDEGKYLGLIIDTPTRSQKHL